MTLIAYIISVKNKNTSLLFNVLLELTHYLSSSSLAFPLLQHLKLSSTLNGILSELKCIVHFAFFQNLFS